MINLSFPQQYKMDTGLDIIESNIDEDTFEYIKWLCTKVEKLQSSVVGTFGIGKYTKGEWYKFKYLCKTEEEAKDVFGSEGLFIYKINKDMSIAPKYIWNEEACTWIHIDIMK